MKTSPKTKIIYGVCAALVVTGLAVGLVILFNDRRSDSTPHDQDINHSSDTDYIELDLANYSSDLIIANSGSYRLSGSFTHAIIVDAPDATVELLLDGIEVNNSETAAIAALNGKQLTINTAANTENRLSDSGSSDYDGCIYSEIELILGGDGTLIVDGNQTEGEGIATEAKNLTINGGKYIITSNDDGLNAGGDGATITINDGELYIDAGGDGIDSNRNAIINGGKIFVMGSDVGGDAGIDTDDGFEINGGTVIALGSDMLETPLESSQQASLALTLDSAIAKEALIALYSNDQSLISFRSDKSFRTVLISSPELSDGGYMLYQVEAPNASQSTGIITDLNADSILSKQAISVGSQTTFTVNQTVNSYGNGFAPGQSPNGISNPPSGPAPGQNGNRPPELPNQR